jgi:succinate dehydrogenase / fumarate reductase, iron-sulfur subunit
MSHANEPTEKKTRPFVFRVFRHTAGNEQEPRFETFDLDVPPGTTVLTALFMIQQQRDPSLAFRFSCRGAVCGSCGMTINGRCGLACRTQLWSLPAGEIVLEPLPNLNVIRDLVVDMSPFWEKYRRVRPWLHSELTKVSACTASISCDTGARAGSDSETLEGEQRQSPRQFQRIEQYITCILCACCYGACPVLKRQPDYLGPAALAKLQRFAGDSRDHRPAEQLAEVDNTDGVWGCDTVFRCVDACPKDVRPTDGIAALRRRLVLYRVRNLLARRERLCSPDQAAPQPTLQTVGSTSKGVPHETQ